MPLEGQWERQHTPLRRPTGRGGWLFAAVAAILVAAGVVLLIVVLLGSGSTRPASGCIEVTAASTTGAGTIHACGPAAERTCRVAEHQDTALARRIQDECRRMHVRHRGPGWRAAPSSSA